MNSEKALEASTTEPSKKETLFNQIKEGLHTAAQLILAAPVKLPLKLVQAAKYMALAISLLDSLDHKPEPDKKEEENEENRT